MSWHADVLFGLHYDFHAEAKDRELGSELTVEHLLERWFESKPDWVHCDCKGVYGYTSWPTEVGYAPGIARDSLAIYREATRQLGIPLGVHYCGLWDEAAARHQPDWARVDVNRLPDPQRLCPRGPYVQELMIPQLLEVIDRYDIDGFWIDGDAWWAAHCYCERCCSAFRTESGTVTPRSASEQAWSAWLDFQRRSYQDYVRRYIDAVHQRKPECLVSVNWLYTTSQAEPVTLPVDVLSGDFLNDRSGLPALARAFASRDREWNLMAWAFMSADEISFESGWQGWQGKPAAHLCQEAAEILACGGAVMLYLQPERSGQLVASEHEVVAEVARFCRARSEVARGTSLPQAAVLLCDSDFSGDDRVYGLSTAGLLTSPQRSRGFAGALPALLDAGLHADLLIEQDLLARLDEYPLVVIAEPAELSPGLVEALPGYVERGGHLLLSGSEPVLTPELAQLAGVEPAGPLRDDFHFLPVSDGSAVTVRGPWQPVKLAAAREWLALGSGRDPARSLAGSPAITIRELGTGYVAAVPGPIFAAYERTRYPGLRQLLAELFHAVWPEPLAELKAPGPVELTLRELPGSTVVHLVNKGVDPPPRSASALVERVPPLAPVTVRLRLAAKPADVHVVPDGEGTLEWSWEDGILTVHLSELAIHAALVVES